jgi:hypothetical protein
VLALAAAAFLLTRDGGGDDAGGGDDEIFLQSITDIGDDPWTDNFDVFNPDLDRIDVVLEDVPDVDEDAGDNGTPVEGDEPGLYGGERGEVACDKDGIAEQLTDDDDKAAAFADVQGIEADQVEDFIGDLTAVMLRKDTRLTDHGFVDGEAEAREAILEKGTSVLIDGSGVPRVRCASGSPLAEAGDLTLDADTTGDEWPGFDKERVFVVESADDPDDAFILVDNDDEDVFARPAGSDGDEDEDAPVELACQVNEDSDTCQEGGNGGGGGGGGDTTTTEPQLGTGDVQVTLRWNSNADMDLAVTAPNGERVSFSTPAVPSGGQLDIDANLNCTRSDPPVENVFWPPGAAPTGEYLVEVDLFAECDTPPGEAFELTITVGGDEIVETGTAQEGTPVTFTFNV